MSVVELQEKNRVHNSLLCRFNIVQIVDPGQDGETIRDQTFIWEEIGSLKKSFQEQDGLN